MDRKNMLRMHLSLFVTINSTNTQRKDKDKDTRQRHCWNEGPPVSRLCFCLYRTHRIDRAGILLRQVSLLTLQIRIFIMGDDDSGNILKNCSSSLRPQLGGGAPGCHFLPASPRFLTLYELVTVGQPLSRASQRHTPALVWQRSLTHRCRSDPVPPLSLLLKAEYRRAVGTVV